MAFGGVGTNHHWGAARNPWDAEAHRASGGSSAGAGVSLAEGSAIVAMGSDTAGIFRLVLADGAWIVLLGLAAGLADDVGQRGHAVGLVGLVAALTTKGTEGHQARQHCQACAQ